MNPLLSVLIPSVPSRLTRAASLMATLQAQICSLPVEVLILTDNKQRTIGAKRQALLDIAKGEYVGFLDDDDEISPDYIQSIAYGANFKVPDVIVFDSLCIIGESSPVLCRHGMQFANEQYNPAGFSRKPWHIHYWRRSIAQSARFPDVSYGEDWAWCEQIIGRVKIWTCASDKPLYTYRYDSTVSEAHV